MKIDKSNPAHWIALLLFAANVLGALLLRPLCRRRGACRTVVLYGHKLNGNLLALHRYWLAYARDKFDLVFLTMDKRYVRGLLLDGVRAVLATRVSALMLLCRADAVISDHGLHSMSLMVGHSSIRFFDVWHGFGFKGHHYSDFRVLRRYDEVWVDSPLQKSFYVGRFGFDSRRVVATGYARTDRLVRLTEERSELRRRFGLPAEGKVVLFAPTWQQDMHNRSMFPFGLSEASFLAPMATMAERLGCTFAIRAHLNASIKCVAGSPRLRFLPFADHPDTEALLLASDVLVADWSSIVFDWLLLDRPTLFLDVPAPFATGHTLEPRHRYGKLVGNLDDLLEALERYLRDPHDYAREFGAYALGVRREVFGDCADGRAAERCTHRLEQVLRGDSADAA